MPSKLEIRVVNIISNYLSKSSLSINPKMKSVLQEFQKSVANGKDFSPYSLRTELATFYSDKSKVFANNYLNFEDVKVIGFDLDYTLVTYTVELQKLIYNLAKDIMVSAYSFPPSFKDLKFDPNFPIRGLSVDITNGVLCKLSHIQRVGSRNVFKGKRPLSADEIRDIYGGSRHVSYDNITKMQPLNDQFSMAEACLIADAIECLERQKLKTGESYTAQAVLDDVRASITEVHMSGIMHTTVLNDLSKYVEISPKLPDLLEHLHASGKKLFLATNSAFPYAEKVMTYALGLPQSSPSIDWRMLFDVVICSAKKPSFFTSNRSFRHFEIESQRASAMPVTQLLPGQVYLHGSAQAMRRILNWSGKEVIYVGDNLLADLVEAKRAHGWLTACVIHELEHEITVLEGDKFRRLHALRGNVRDILQYIQTVLEHDRRNSGMLALGDEDNLLIRQLDEEIKSVSHSISLAFNPNFGSVFRTDGNPTYFAFNIRRYVDLYMSKVADLLHYSANHRFFPSHPIRMAHDPRVSTTARSWKVIT